MNLEDLQGLLSVLGVSVVGILLGYGGSAGGISV